MNRNKKYIDITRNWLKNKISCGYVINAKTVRINNKTFITNKYNKINLKNNELELAFIVVKIFGGILELLPDIGEEEGIRCGDFFYKNEIWDAKEVGIHAKSKRRAIDNILKTSKGQAQNFIVDISRCRISKTFIINQVKKIYSTKNRDWIDKIILLKNGKLIKVYQRNKRD